MGFSSLSVNRKILSGGW